MDCNELKQRILADPSATYDEADLAACDGARALLDEVRALDEKLKPAMAIDVPPLSMPELPEIDTDKVVGLPTRRGGKAPIWLATAAAVTLAAFLGINSFVGHDHSGLSIEDQIIAHMDHEPWSLKVTDVPVNDRRLNRIVPASIANVSHDAGLITYAESCEINGNVVPHLVIQGERGPVTIILLPDEEVDGPSRFEGGGFSGVLVPVGKGSIAIIGEEGPENLERIQREFVSSAAWST